MFCSVLRWHTAAQPRQLGNRDVDRSGVHSGGTRAGCAQRWRVSWSRTALVLLAIPPEIPADIAAIYQFNAEAFISGVEARHVDALRANGNLLLSLVAEADGEFVGHISFSPVAIDSEASSQLLLMVSGLRP